MWEAFQLPGSPPLATGIFPNQPSPYQGQNIKQLWIYCAALLLLLVNLALFFSNFARQEEVFDGHYSFAKGTPGDPSFVTSVFELKGRQSDVEVSLHTDLRNEWAYFHFSLINEATGQAYDFGREVSNYTDEGSPNDDAIIPTVPPGRYYLRVEPEVSSTPISATRFRRLNYELKVTRDVPSIGFYLFAALLILVPPVFLTLRAAGFERSRWQESGNVYPVSESDSEDGDDD